MKCIFISKFGYNTSIYIGNIYNFTKNNYVQLLQINSDLVDISFWIKLFLSKIIEKKLIKKVINNYLKYHIKIYCGIIKLRQLKYL